MIRKFQISGCQNVHDSFQTQDFQGRSQVKLKREFDISNSARTQGHINEDRYERKGTHKTQKSETIFDSRCQANQNLRSLKTILKSINKFKTINKSMKSVGIKKKVVNKKKVDNHVSNFVNKLTRAVPPISTQELYEQKQNILDKNGFILPSWAYMTQIIVNTINFLFLFYLFSFGIVFHQVIANKIIRGLQFFSLFLIILNLLSNFFIVSIVNGKRLLKIRQISLNYIKGSLCFDFLCLIVLIVDLSVDSIWMRFVRILFLCKFNDFKVDLQKLEYNFINTFYREHYWGIFHIMIENFLVAHIIAIILLLMSEFNSETNWLIKAKVDLCPWYQQYIWAYYWAVTTMLSIGYGDIVVSNYIEAICMIFVETFSCIILAYTINNVGNLLNNLRSKDQQKNKSLKIFKQIVDKNQISRRTQEKVGSYISEVYEIKTKFNYEDQKKLLNQLPNDAKIELLKQCNSKIFRNILIFKSMSQKLVTELANKVQLKIAHPQEIIFNPDSYRQLQVLKEGKVGYKVIEQIFKKKYIMNQVYVHKDQMSRLLSLNFLISTVPKYIITSLSYSILCSISMETLEQSLRNYPIDNQKYCNLKDKSKHILNEFEVIDCQTCKTKHTKADCPKLHYIPFRQTIIYKSLAKCKTYQIERYPVLRQKVMSNCYKMYHKIKETRMQNEGQTNQNDIYQKQMYIKSLTELIFRHILKICPTEPKMNTIGQEDTFQLRQTGKLVRQFKEDPNNRVNSLYLVANKILNCHKENKTRSKNLTLFSEIKFMMGIQSDTLYDFSNYFPDMNPKNITLRFNKKNQQSFPKTKQGRMKKSLNKQ